MVDAEHVVLVVHNIILIIQIIGTVLTVIVIAVVIIVIIALWRRYRKKRAAAEQVGTACAVNECFNALTAIKEAIV